MLRRLFAVAFVVAALLLIMPSIAGAASQPSGISKQMQGVAQVDRSQQVPKLLLSADAADGSGYHIDAALQPVSVRSAPQGRGRGEGGGGSQRVTNLAGQFTLSGPNMADVTGNASGQLSSNGTGTISMSDASGTTQISGDFVIDSAGNVQMDISGQIPAQVSTEQPSVSAQTSGAAAPQVDHAFWYISRAAGLSAYLMLFLNVVLGLAVNTRIMDALVARWRSFDLHEFTALLAMGLLAIHALALLGDQYIGFSLPQLLVPLGLPYRPFWTAMGIFAMYLLVVITASSYMRKQLSYKAWRAIHYLSFGAFVMAMGHGIFAGTDTTMPWAQGMYLSTGVIVLLLTIRRFSTAKKKATVRPSVQRTPSRVG
jgi:methionine sulfoxide reductase heme-binding subunit